MRSPKRTNDYRPLEVRKTELFTTPFYTMRFIADYEEIIRDVRTAIKAIEQKFGDDKSRNYTTYFDREIHDKYITDKEWCKNLATSLKDSYMDLMHKEFLFSPRDMKMSRDKVHLMLWVNRYTEDHVHSAHNHKGAKISGTFYVKTSQPCAPIVFESPTEYANMLFATKDLQIDQGQMSHYGTPAVQKEMHYQPNDGDIAMWPAYLYHHVPRQENQEERISISFNLDHHDDLGYGYSDEILDNLDYDFLYHE